MGGKDGKNKPMKNSTNLEIFTQNENFQCKNKSISKKNSV